MLVTLNGVSVFAYSTSYDDYDENYYNNPSFEYEGNPSLSSSSSTYGASSSRVESSADKLNQLGLMIGYEDGSLGLERTITRAEFVTLILRLLNMEPTSGSTGGYSMFRDTTYHWASQSINVAASMGFVNGYPDGTFQPDGQITSPEIQAILIRVLNYTDSLSSAPWPQNMIAKSTEIGLAKNISNLTNTATRGLAAVMIDNALEIPLMEVTAYSTGAYGNYISVNKDSSILNKYLGYGKLKGDVVTTSENSSRLDSEEFYVDNAKFYFADENDVDEKTIFSLQRNANHLLGRSIIAYFNDDYEIVWIDYSDNYDDENVFYSTIKKYSNKYITITIDGEEERFKVSNDTSIYIDGSAGDLDDIEVGQFVKIILSGNTVSFLKVYDFDKQNVVITNISSNYIHYIDEDGGEGRFNLNNYDGVNVFIGDDETSIEALRTNMVASVIVNDNDELDFYTSNNASITGTLTKIYGESIYVNGNYYNLADNMTYSDYSYNKYSDEDVVVRVITSSSELQAFLDEEIEVVFDLEGNARHFIFGDGYSTSKSLTNVGIVIRKWSADEEYLRIYNPDTDSYATYAYDNNTNRNTLKTPMSYSSITSLSETSLTSNNRYIVGYNYDSDNVLTEVYQPELTEILDVTSLYGSRYINTTDGKYYLDDETIFITDLSDEYNISATTFDDLSVADSLTGVQAIIVTAPYSDSYYTTNTAMYVIFVSGGDSIGTDSDNVAVVTNTYRDRDGYGVELYTTDGVAEYQLATNVSASNYTIGDIVNYRVSSEDSRYAKISYIRPATVRNATVQSTSSNRRSITLSDGNTYIVKSDALVFDLTNENVNNLSRNDIIKNDASVSAISKYDYINYVINADEQIVAIYILDAYDDGNDFEDENLPTAVITMSPRTNLTPSSQITWSFAESRAPGSRQIVDTEWSSNKASSYSAGTHTVSLRVKDSSGSWSNWTSITFTVTSDGTGSGITTETENRKPTAVITMNPDSNITTATEITWDYRSSTCSNMVSESCSIVNYEWNNNNTYFRTAGTYTVYLRVQDSLGTWSDWTSKQVTVTADGSGTPVTVQKPVANITMSPDPTQTRVTAGTPITITSAGSTIIPGTSISREDFYGAVSGSNTFEAGSHTVSLRLLDSRGVYSELKQVTFTIYEENVAPVISSVTVSPSDAKTGDTITLTANVSDANNDNIVAYEWDGGAGTSSTYTTTYSTPGTKTVTLRVKDANNAWSETYTKTFQVEESITFPTVTGLVLSIPEPTTTDKVTITPTYTGTSNVLLIDDFGGDYQSSGYYTAGTHRVTFRYTDGNGNYSNEVSIQFVVRDAG